MREAAEVHVVVGGQFGSEGKGAVAAALVERYYSEGVQAMSVRVGGPNAGHTAYDYNGRKWALRQVPVGVVKNTAGPLFIAAGSEIDVDVLRDEVNALEEAGHDVRSRLFIDKQATVIESIDKETEAAGGFTGKFGSTAKGIGAARARRLRREAPLAGDYSHALDKLGFITVSTGLFMTALAETHGTPIVIEGTQGYGLGLHAGWYPYCTAGDVRVCDALAQVGIHAHHPAIDRIEPWVVLRAFPIRVAGNSGPMANETTWQDLGLPEERTTVTQLVRRVGEWDQHLANAAIEANGRAVNVAITMADQLDPTLAGLTDVEQLDGCHVANDWLVGIMDKWPEGAKLAYIGTGPDTQMWLY